MTQMGSLFCANNCSRQFQGELGWLYKVKQANLPCQKERKMTDLTMKNLSTGLYGMSSSRVAK